MKETLKQEYSLYESPTIDVMKITGQDIVCISGPGVDENVNEGGGEANKDWWQ